MRLSPGRSRPEIHRAKKGSQLLGVWRRVSHAQKRWEIPGGRMLAPARIVLPAACGWDSRLHTDPVIFGTGLVNQTHSRNLPVQRTGGACIEKPEVG